MISRLIAIGALAIVVTCVVLAPAGMIAARAQAPQHPIAVMRGSGDAVMVLYSDACTIDGIPADMRAQLHAGHGSMPSEKLEVDFCWIEGQGQVLIIDENGPVMVIPEADFKPASYS